MKAPIANSNNEYYPNGESAEEEQSCNTCGICCGRFCIGCKKCRDFCECFQCIVDCFKLFGA